jgi:hypothetical protein
MSVFFRVWIGVVSVAAVAPLGAQEGPEFAPDGGASVAAGAAQRAEAGTRVQDVLDWT